MKIALDAGHGFNTAGKRTPDDIREWTLNDRVLRAFDKEINKYNNVTTVRLDDATGKTDVSLFERTKKAKANKCDVLLSFHHNAYQSKWGDHGGTETLYFNGRGTEAYAKAMNDSIVRTLGLRDRGIKHKNFHMVREVNFPSVMVEVGFMDSNTDKAIRDAAKSELVGVNLAKDFAKFFGLTLGDKPVEKPIEKPVGKTIEQMAQEVYAGKHGTGHANRQKSLGVDNTTYEKVRARVNELAGVTTVKPTPKPPTKPRKSIVTMAQEVYDGKHGTGHSNRQKSLGIDNATYAKVRDRVNQLAGVKSKPASKSIDQMAREVIALKHGNGHAQRQKSLGIDAATYAKVRARVNQLI